MDIKNLDIPDDLTDKQKESIKNYFCGDRLFFGISPGAAIADFRQINEWRKNGENNRADKFETGLFGIMNR